MGQDVCLIRSGRESQRFLNYFLHSMAMDRQLALVLIGSTFDRINVAEIKALIIAVPPKAEQDAIAVYLDGELGNIEKLITDTNREIPLLREYRTRLIADVVTGKLDVGQAAAQLPVEPEEAEPIDDADALSEEDESAQGADLETAPEEADA